MTTLAKRLNANPLIDFTLKSCPFCGASAQVEFWHGGRPSKRMISCSGNSCDVRPQVTGETRALAVAAWQRRAES